MILLGFPLLIVPLVIYNILTFLMPVAWVTEITAVALMSGSVWRVTFSDALLALALVCLMFEFIKAARLGRRGIVDHLLSTIVFGAALAEFLLVAGAATSTFALIVLMCLVDVIAGIATSLGAGRRDDAIERADPA